MQTDGWEGESEREKGRRLRRWERSGWKETGREPWKAEAEIERERGREKGMGVGIGVESVGREGALR